MNAKQQEQTYIAHTYGRFDVVLTEGKGSLLKDDTGKTYIDLGSGIAVNSFGLCDETWTNAVKAQLDKLAHTSNLYYTLPASELAEKLCRKSGMKRVFFSNSGAESNECAIKTARKYAADHYGKDRFYIITLRNSFHGRTITTLAATGQDHYHELFQPLTDGFLHASDMEEIRMLCAKYPVAAVMIELIQGEGGVCPLAKEFVQELAAFTKQEDILLICDEVQTGNGRCGAMYAYMRYGIMPDIVSTAKGLGGGLPIGATLLGEKVQDTLAPGDHGSTFGGNPVACAGAITIVDRIDDALLKDVLSKEAYIRQSLSGAKGVVSVDGMGLMLGIQTTRPAADVIEDCIKGGVLVLSAKTKVRLLPALNIPMDQLARAIDVLKKACAAE